MNAQEMRAVLYALTLIQKCAMGHTKTLMSDNAVVVAYLNK